MKLAVSACLLGENVRYDGGHKRDRFITDQLSNYSEFISFCPEAMAFGTPRPSIRMVVKDEEISILLNKAVQKLQKSASNMKELVSFHTKYKFMLQAKDEKLYREMGKLVGNHEERSFTEVLSAYVLMFKQAIAKKVHANAIETCLSTWLDFLIPYPKELALRSSLLSSK